MSYYLSFGIIEYCYDFLLFYEYQIWFISLFDAYDLKLEYCKNIIIRKITKEGY